MTDFRKLAADLKATETSKKEAARAAAQAQREAHKAVVDAGVAALQQYVMPYLRKAQDEFRQEGIESVIDEYFDVEGHSIGFDDAWPSVRFFCSRQVVGHGGRAREMHGQMIFFACDGKILKAGSDDSKNSRYPSNDLGRANVVEFVPLMNRAITRAAETLFQKGA